MFRDQVAGVYDVFINCVNRRTHQKLKAIVSALINPEDAVLHTGIAVTQEYYDKSGDENAIEALSRLDAEEV